MKIGVLTIHHVTNYGAVWQAYALSHWLARAGHDVEVIDYRPVNAVEYYAERIRLSREPNILPTLQSLSFQRFIRRRLPLGPSLCHNAVELSKASQGYEMLIAGSDQIWCTGEGSFRGYDSNFFLDFCTDPTIRKVSYAASAGNTKDFAEHSGAIRESLKLFSAMSVRDENTAALVERVTGQKPTVVLDPVFLHDFGEFVGDIPPGNDAVVFAEQPQRFETLAQEIAKKYRLRVVSIGARCRTADVHLRLVSPVSWIQKIKGARVVLTDFFHGTAVALRFGRPLVVSAPPGKTSKITDLLQRMELMDLFLDSSEKVRGSIFGILNDPTEFTSRLQPRLGALQRSSCRFLEEALVSTRKPEK